MRWYSRLGTVPNLRIFLGAVAGQLARKAAPSWEVSPKLGSESLGVGAPKCVGTVASGPPRTLGFF